MATATEPQAATPPDQPFPSSDLGTEYDPEKLREFISSSLADHEPSPNTDEQPHVHDALFSFGDTRLLEKLNGILLEENVQPESAVLILDRLREELYSGTSSGSIQDLHTIIVNSKLKGTTAKAVLPSWNIKDPDVVFVSDTPPRWGDTDAQFVQTLKDVRFNSNICAWTSVVRYWPKSVSDLDPEEERRWIDLLFSELRIWRPKLIIPLGGYATSIFLGSDLKLSDRVGNLHWLGPWVVLPLYSYPYAIKANKLDQLKQGLEQGFKYCFGDF